MHDPQSELEYESCNAAYRDWAAWTHDRHDYIGSHSFMPLTFLDRVDHEFAPLFKSASLASLNLNISTRPQQSPTKSRTLHISSRRF